MDKDPRCRASLPELLFSPESLRNDESSALLRNKDKLENKNLIKTN